MAQCTHLRRSAPGTALRLTPQRAPPHALSRPRSNPEYFTSVHLVGSKLEEEQQLAAQQEVEEWRSKVVVDTLHFTPHFSKKQLGQVRLPRCGRVLSPALPSLAPPRHADGSLGGRAGRHSA